MRRVSVEIRFYILRAVTIIAFVIIAGKLWQLQIVSSQDYQRSADQNRFRLIPVDAPRGILYDRVGRQLVRNVSSFSVSIVPAGLPENASERRAVLQRLSDLLQMPIGSEEGLAGVDSLSANEFVRGFKGPSIIGILNERTVSPYAPVRIASNVDRQAAFILEEEHIELPGVVVEAAPLREYTTGALTAHLIGYVGRIPSERLQDYIGEDKKGYLPDDLVGLNGIELTQERLLRGVKGQKHIEVDAFEREVAVIASKPAVPGYNVKLTLDLELQRVVEEALREGMANAKSRVGVAIAMDPRTGEILAMVSLPSYDNNLFSGGISYEDYAGLSNDKGRPLLNHAVSGQYPPGSTFKIVTASGALQEGVVGRSTTRTCQGTLLLPNRYFPDDVSKAQKFYCWFHAGHGTLSIVGALEQSCDAFFYQVAGGYQDFQGLGIDKLAQYARMYGYGETTRVDLSGEASGLVPSDYYKRLNTQEQWNTGDTYNAAIGQGYVLATPLQVVNATAAVANGGTLYRPQLVYQVKDAEGHLIQSFAPEVLHKLDISSENLNLVRQGMFEVVNGAAGTAYLLHLPEIAVAGKTGTAEFPGVDDEGKPIRDKDGNLPTHASFTAFAPFDNPRIAVVVFLEAGGEGSRAAVPVAAKILRHFFGVPGPSPTPTAGAPAPGAPTPIPTPTFGPAAG